MKTIVRRINFNGWLGTLVLNTDQQGHSMGIFLKDGVNYPNNFIMIPSHFEGLHPEILDKHNDLAIETYKKNDEINNMPAITEDELIDFHIMLKNLKE